MPKEDIKPGTEIGRHGQKLSMARSDGSLTTPASLGDAVSHETCRQESPASRARRLSGAKSVREHVLRDEKEG